MPRFLASLTHAATVSTVTPKADPVPMAKPLARAVASSSSSFFRIAPRSCTASIVVSPTAKGTPSFTARPDATERVRRYAEAGIPSYWIVDPAEPRLLAFELAGADYAEVADVSGDEEWTAQRPFPVTIRPSALLD